MRTLNNRRILEVKNLSAEINTSRGIVKAVRGVNFDVLENEILAIVGESGSGKTVTAKTIIGLLNSNFEMTNGKIIFDGNNLTDYSPKDLKNIRGRHIAMIFQDPMSSLNPVLTIGEQIVETIREHRDLKKAEAIEEAVQLLTRCGIENPNDRFKEYPHEFSGGQKQRIVIAIALAGQPDILIADEPTTALDARIQAQIIELLQNIKKETGMSIIFITHDLSVVSSIADRVAVMYAGKIVEYGLVKDIFYNPKHPYTWALLESTPHGYKQQKLYSIQGHPPNMMEEFEGDAFAPRNTYALAIDFKKQPPMFQVNDYHYAATWLLHPYAPEIEPPEGIRRRRQHFEDLKESQND